MGNKDGLPTRQELQDVQTEQMRQTQALEKIADALDDVRGQLRTIRDILIRIANRVGRRDD